MKFQFRLESLMKHKKRLEQEAMKVMIEAQRHLEGAQRDLNGLYTAIDLAREERFASETSDSKENGSMAFVESFIDGQKLRIETQKDVVREKQMEFEQTQEKYRAAAIELKSLEKLKEKQLAEFTKKVAMKKQKQLDEAVSMRFDRDY